MANAVRKYGVATTFEIVLTTSAGAIKTTPTIAAGDFKIAKDGGSLANPTTLPSESPASSGRVLVSLSATEMQAAKVFVRWVDQAGAEWLDGAFTIETYGHASAQYPLGDGVTVATDANDKVDVGSLNGTAYASAGLVTNVAAIKAQTDNLPAQPAQESTVVAVGGAVMTVYNALVTLAGKFTGITSLANWLKLALRKDFTDATASTEIGGTYSASTDSLEAQQESAGGGGASVEDIVAALSGITITYSGPVMPDRSIVLDAGDDYTAAGRKLTYTITGYTGASLDGEECELRFLPLSLWRTVGDETEGTVIATATISQTGTTLTIEFAIASSQTASLGPATVKDGRVQYKAKVFVPSIEATLLRADATVYRSF